jgi:hypothetical protein
MLKYDVFGIKININRSNIAINFYEILKIKKKIL